MNMRIGYQGIAGSYSEMTVQDYLKSLGSVEVRAEDIVPYENFEQPLEDLMAEDLDVIVFPVENSTTGSITRVTDLLHSQPVIAFAELYQPVRHTLWGVEGARIDQLRSVQSHPEALSQCQDFFASHPYIKEEPSIDTAQSAADVKKLNDPHVASIASPRAGELYELNPLKVNVQDESSNTTRFYIIEKMQAEKEYPGSHAVFYLESKHESGALSKILQIFDVFNVNLTKLTSRPIVNQPFQYGFLLEANGEAINRRFALLMAMLEEVSEYVQLIGKFNPTKPK